MEELEHKPYSKFYTQKQKKTYNYSEFKSYLIVFSIFITFLVILSVLFDKIIIPFIVYDKKEIIIPKITNLEKDIGIQKLEELGLSVKITNEVFSEKYPENTILSQIPTEGTKVRQGRTIYITISKGNQKVEVPNLVGLPLQLVRLELIKKGLALGSVAYDFSEIYGKDTVIYQSNPSGSKVPYGYEIDLVVSNGSNANSIVPTLIGIKLEEAESILIKSGFEIGEIIYKVSETFQPNTVIEQSPSQGELMPLKTKINLIISK